MSYWYLEVVRGIEVGRRYLLSDGGVSVGRSSQNNVALNPGEKMVSSHHAIIYKSTERILLQDLQSTNGSFVNDQQVQEKELAAGDIVGFGKTGPRLKLVVSETELDTSAKNADSFDITTSFKTVEDRQLPPRRRRQAISVNGEDETVAVKPAQMPVAGAFVTMEMEQKLLSKKMGSSDLHKLLKDGKRLDKIISGGNLGETQAGMLRTMHGASEKMRRQWMVIIGVIVAVSVVAVSYFAIRSFQYQAALSHAVHLKEQLDDYENKIARIRRNPNADPAELKRLIMELENKSDVFTDLKDQLDEEDLGKIYTNPIEQIIAEILGRFGETEYHIPPEMTERIEHHLSIYSGRMKNVIAKYLVRKEKYAPMIERVLREKKLPLELLYISMLESGFNPRALSHAGARGLWQFMPHTGRRYGLRVDDAVDERLEPEKATYAAAEYFKDLIALFGSGSSIMLAMAGYNAGEGRVNGALRKIEDPMRNRDFWYIYRMGYLAEETNEYIPRMMALMIIDENQEKYGFAATRAEAPAAELEREDDFLEIDLRHND